MLAFYEPVALPSLSFCIRIDGRSEASKVPTFHPSFILSNFVDPRSYRLQNKQSAFLCFDFKYIDHQAI